jgi:hypothetical protein
LINHSKSGSGKSSIVKNKRKEAPIFIEMKEHLLKNLKRKNNNLEEEVPEQIFDLKKKKNLMRTASMGDQIKSKELTKQDTVKKETVHRYPVKIKLENKNKIQIEQELPEELEIIKKRPRRKMPEPIEEEIEVETPIKTRNFKNLNKIRLSNESVQGTKIIMTPIQSNVASIDQKKLLETTKLIGTEKKKTIVKPQGELSFKNDQMKLTGNFFQKPPKMDQTSRNPTFANFNDKVNKDQSTVKKNPSPENKQNIGNLDPENKEILNKMRKPIPEKKERDSRMLNTNQNSENGSHLKEEEDDDEEFPFEEFGF